MIYAVRIFITIQFNFVLTSPHQQFQCTFSTQQFIFAERIFYDTVTVTKSLSGSIQKIITGNHVAFSVDDR